MMRKLILMTLGAAALFGAAPALAADGPGERACFYANQWRGWSAPDPETLLIRVGVNDVYRVELTPGSRLRKGSDFLVNEIRGSSTICSPVDLNLYLSDDLGFRRPLLARTLTKLTEAEVAAIPRQDLP